MRNLISQAVPLIVAAAAVYALLAGFAYIAADSVMFQPPRPGYGDGPDILKLETSTGERIAAIHLTNEAAEYTILHSHGNAEDLGHVRPLLHVLHGLGYAVLAYDYPGYGTSEGRPSTKGAVRAIEAAYAYLTRDRGVPPERIILYGRSIGSGPSLELAARAPVAGVVLESAFTSAHRVLTRYPLLPFDRFPNLRRIQGLERPVLVIHGTADGIVPFSHGRDLYDAALGPKRKLWVEGAGHNDVPIVAGERWTDALREFGASLRAAD